MTIHASRPTVAAISALLLLTGCAQGGGAAPAAHTSPATPSVELPDGEAALVLRVEHTGGFLPPEVSLSRVPLYSLYADGRLITEGAVPAIYPGPALPSVWAQQLDDAEVRELADRALAAGVAETADLGSPPIADAPSTRFTLATAEGTVVREVYALSESVGLGGGSPPGLTDDQRAGRDRLSELVDALFEVGQRPAEQFPVEPYVPEAVAAVVTPWSDPEDGLPHPEQPWPGPELPGEPVRGPLEVGCVVATGEQAASVLTAAAAANAATPWISGGSRWSVQFRPLLPDEAGCADLLG